MSTSNHQFARDLEDEMDDYCGAWDPDECFDAFCPQHGSGEAPASFKVEVEERPGARWVSNGQRFATEAEATAAMDNLQSRWHGPHGFRVVPSEDPVNYRWLSDGGFSRAEAMPRG
jgi:hypothetical protein